MTLGQKRSFGEEGTRVFIGQQPGVGSRGLNDDTTDEELKNYFDRYGTVTKVAQHRWADTSKKKGFGYLEFAEFEAAQAAMGTHTVCGVALEIKNFTHGGQPKSAQPPIGPVHGGGYSNGDGYGYGADNKRARTDMAGGQGGPMEMMENMRNMMGQMQQMSGGGNVMAGAYPQQPPPPSYGQGKQFTPRGKTGNTRVFIGQAPGTRSRGLTDDVSDEDLRNFFKRYGTVTGVAQHRWEDTGKKKGFGYLEFAEYEASQACMGIHTVMGIQLEIKPYTQGSARGVTSASSSGPAPPTPSYPSTGATSSYAYGTGEAGYRAQMMEKMKTMMVQMQQMQQQIPGGGMGDQIGHMQQTMYAMMQSQYMAALGSPAASAYSGYPSTSYSGYSNAGGYSNPPLPKPPGTDHY